MGCRSRVGIGLGFPAFDGLQEPVMPRYFGSLWTSLFRERASSPGVYIMIELGLGEWNSGTYRHCKLTTMGSQR